MVMAERRPTRWNEFLMDQEGEFSFKRIFTAILMVMYISYFWINLFTGLTVHENVLEFMQWTIMLSLTTIGIEPFSRFRRTTVVSKDTIVTQEDSPVVKKAVNSRVKKAVKKAVDEALPEDSPKKEVVMPELME